LEWEGTPVHSLETRDNVALRLALGGGFGWLSGQYGTVVDNMLGATVVIANGTIVHCTRTRNADVSVS
jgi:hypothetical protein